MNPLQTELTDLLTQLIKLPSYVDEKNNVNERQVSDFIKRYFSETSFSTITQTVKDNRENIIITKGNPELLLVGHTDTARPGTWTDALTPIIKDGNIYGRGSADMKAGLAVMMLLAKNYQKEGLSLLFDIDEEYDFLGMKHFKENIPFSQFNPKLALFPEPTDLRITNAHRGFYEIEITVKGKGAHASKPEQGIDAGNTYCAIKKIHRKLKNKKYYDENSGLYSSLNIGYSQIGTANEKGEISTNTINMVPNFCRAIIDIRPTPQLYVQGIGHIEQLVGEELRKKKLSLIEFNVRNNNAPLDTNIAEISNVISALQEEKLPVKYYNGGGFTEAAYLRKDFGTPSISLGPGVHKTIHKEGEYTTIDSLEQCYRVYERILNKILQN